MKSLTVAVAVSFILVFLLPVANTAAAATTASITISPPAAVVGRSISISGQGYPPNTHLTLEWGTADASWVVAGNPPRVTGVNATPIQSTLGQMETDAAGSFSLSVAVPIDYGGQHVIQAFFVNGTAITGRGIFTLEPSFSISPTSGPAGTPIKVTALGLGYGPYSTNYFLYWDNLQVGYFTALSSRGATNFTFYASGTPGTHYIEIYQGYPGPGYLNPWDAAPSLETQSLFPPYIPFHAEFNMTGDPSSSSFTIPSLVVLAAALTSIGIFVSVARTEPEKQRRFGRQLAAVVIIVAIVAAGAAAYLSLAPSSTGAPSGFTPQATVVRPAMTVPQNNATTGPIISVSPDITSVGQTITVSGLGFEPGSQLPLVFSNRVGDNILGFKLVNEPLRSVTAGSDGKFSFTMQTPATLGGIHYISASNLTQNSNGTLLVQRTATVNATEGPDGTVVAVVLRGVGWTFNTNIATLDYDNSYIGYGCGFFSDGNVTFYLTITGAPGIHTIDVYPSVWWGPSTQTNQLSIEYRYPLLTPQDGPALIPSFHFTFLVTGSGNSTQTAGTLAIGSLATLTGYFLMFATTGLALGGALQSVVPEVAGATRIRMRASSRAGQ
jgi:hypothetical protein